MDLDKLYKKYVKKVINNKFNEIWKIEKWENTSRFWAKLSSDLP